MPYTDIPEELRKLPQWFLYEPSTGYLFYQQRHFGNNLTRRQKQWNTLLTGKKVEGFLNNGYIRVSIGNGKQLYLHQIAFILMENYLPIEVDHEDLNKLNNKWENLRDANRILNSQNSFKRKINKSGLKGVSWAKSNKCWRMDIAAYGIKYYSYHTTAELAYKAYCEMSAKLHGAFGCVE